jgi:hypothetical protein
MAGLSAREHGSGACTLRLVQGEGGLLFPGKIAGNARFFVMGFTPGDSRWPVPGQPAGEMA